MLVRHPYNNPNADVLGDTLTQPSHWNDAHEPSGFLRDWQAQLAKIQLGLTTQAVVAWIGDSWSSQGNITNPLSAMLQNIYGNAGAGYIGANDSSFNPAGIARTVLGTWTRDSGASSNGVNLTDMNSLDVSTPGSVQFVATATGFVIHYLKQPSGGSFTWQIDGGTATTVNTANASVAAAQVTISGLTNASHTLLIKVTVAGTAGVTIAGADCQLAVPGVRFHNLGFTGTSTIDWSTVNSTVWKAELAALAPNLVVILLGANDQGASLALATYQANLTSIAQRIRSAMPNADIMFVAPGDNGVTGPAHFMVEYATAMRSTVVTLASTLTGPPPAFVDTYHLLGDYPTANARGLYTNTTHVNANGGSVISYYVGQSLTEQTFPQTGAYFDSMGEAKGNVTIPTPFMLSVNGISVNTLGVAANLNMLNGSYQSFIGPSAGWFGLHSAANRQLTLADYADSQGVTVDVSTDGTLLLLDHAGAAHGMFAAASVRGNAVTYANRPGAPVEGMLVALTDSNTAAWGTTISGGGTNHVLAYYNGTNWTVAGK